MLPFILFSTMTVFASDVSSVYEKSFPRDNTFCSYKGRRYEFLIRGGHKFTEPKERGYGEFLFYRDKNKKAHLLPLNELRADTFKFHLGDGSLCTKSHGYMIDSSTLAVLLQKENRPFKDKLVIQLFNLKTETPSETIETEFSIDKALASDSGFAFRSMYESYNPEMGKVSIENETFIFQEKSFPLWINYSSKGFETLPQLTYGKFPWKKVFKDQDDFLKESGWDSVEKRFKKSVVYLAVNHKLKKSCLLLIEKKQKLAGNESWRCYAL